MTQIRVIVDGDACPVKDEVMEVAERHGAGVVLVSNGGLRPSRYPGARIVRVSDGFDAADDWIAEEATSVDVVITADIPLASRALEKGAAVLGPDGRPFTIQNIGAALSFRSFNQHLRESGTSNTYNKPFAPADRSRFRSELDSLLRRTIIAS